MFDIKVSHFSILMFPKFSWQVSDTKKFNPSRIFFKLKAIINVSRFKHFSITIVLMNQFLPIAKKNFTKISLSLISTFTFPSNDWNNSFNFLRNLDPNSGVSTILKIKSYFHHHLFKNQDLLTVANLIFSN